MRFGFPATHIEAHFQEITANGFLIFLYIKGSSHLTEAHRMDVRSEIASIAGVSTGNVTKAKQLRETAHPRVELAVRTGEISIHKGWQWSRLSPHKGTDEDNTEQANADAAREPITLGLLAMGSPGLSIWRREESVGATQ